MRTDMGYEDHFYVRENIMGYTGQLLGDPTVYFTTRNRHGRITQNHPIHGNIGRGLVKSRDGYTFGNEHIEGEVRLVEYQDGKKFHTSRNMLILVDPTSSDNTLDILERAITRFPDLKRKYDERREALAWLGTQVPNEDDWWRAQVE
jgi:hypothetical protein